MGLATNLYKNHYIASVLQVAILESVLCGIRKIDGISRELSLTRQEVLASVRILVAKKLINRSGEKLTASTRLIELSIGGEAKALSIYWERLGKSDMVFGGLPE